MKIWVGSALFSTVQNDAFVGDPRHDQSHLLFLIVECISWWIGRVCCFQNALKVQARKRAQQVAQSFELAVRSPVLRVVEHLVEDQDGSDDEPLGSNKVFHRAHRRTVKIGVQMHERGRTLVRLKEMRERVLEIPFAYFDVVWNLWNQPACVEVPFWELVGKSVRKSTKAVEPVDGSIAQLICDLSYARAGVHSKLERRSFYQIQTGQRRHKSVAHGPRATETRHRLATFEHFDRTLFGTKFCHACTVSKYERKPLKMHCLAQSAAVNVGSRGFHFRGVFETAGFAVVILKILTVS